MRRSGLPLLAALAATLVPAPVRAQAPARASGPPPNAAVIGRLAVECMGDVPLPATFRLDAPETAPYVRAALADAWRTGGKTALLAEPAGQADSALAARPARLAYRVEAASVRYGRAGRGRLARTADLRLRLSLTDARGALAYDAVCARAAEDRVPARMRGALGEAYPELAGTGPAPAAWRRVAEPVLLAGAVGLSTLLFFSLRSR